MQHVREAVAGIEVLHLEERGAGDTLRRGGRGHVGLAEIDLAHPRVAADCLRRAVRQHLPLVQHDHAARQPEDHFHVVLDEKDRHLRGEIADLRQHPVALPRAHAGGGLVEEQEARPGSERERDLEEPPVAVRQRRGGG